MAAPSSHVRVGGAWKKINKMHVRVAGTWKEIKKAHVKVGGVWKEIYARFNADELTNPNGGGALSNGNMTFNVGVLDWYHVRSVTSHHAGKKYIELTPHRNNWNIGLGFRRVADGMAPNGYGRLGGPDQGEPAGFSICMPSTQSYLWVLRDGTWAIYGSGSKPAINTGCLKAAIDFDAGKIWFGDDTTWYSGDPASGASPWVSFMPNTAMWVNVQCVDDQATINFGGSAWKQTPPSGFEGWGTS